jgi:hypothetical protein
METDLTKIRIAGEQQLKENMKFRAFLKGHCSLSTQELDRLVHELTREVAAQIDCDACRKCCDLAPVVEVGELPRLAAVLGMSVGDFRRRHVKPPQFGEIELMPPCPFLREEGGRRYCIAGDAKPTLCAEYPFLMKPDFWTRLVGVVENYGRCPIVYNVYERLKERLRPEFQKAKPAVEEWFVWEESGTVEWDEEE